MVVALLKILDEKWFQIRNRRQRTWYWVAVKGLHFMLGGWHFDDQLLQANCSLKGFSVPCQGRVGAIKLWEVC